MLGLPPRRYPTTCPRKLFGHVRVWDEENGGRGSQWLFCLCHSERIWRVVRSHVSFWYPESHLRVRGVENRTQGDGRCTMVVSETSCRTSSRECSELSVSNWIITGRGCRPISSTSHSLSVWKVRLPVKAPVRDVRGSSSTNLRDVRVRVLPTGRVVEAV